MVNFNKINVNANKVQTGKVAGGNGDLQVKDVKRNGSPEIVTNITEVIATSGIAKSKASEEIAKATTLGSKEEVGGKE